MSLSTRVAYTLPHEKHKIKCAWVYKPLLDIYLHIFITKIYIRHKNAKPVYRGNKHYSISELQGQLSVKQLQFVWEAEKVEK